VIFEYKHLWGHQKWAAWPVVSVICFHQAGMMVTEGMNWNHDVLAEVGLTSGNQCHCCGTRPVLKVGVHTSEWGG
jgi:hypothetical protein